MSRAAAASVESEFERRAERAELLSRRSPAGEGPLRFAAGLLRVQGAVAADLEAEHARSPLTGSLERDAERLLARCAPVLRFAAEFGPEPLAEEATAREKDSPETSRTRLLVFWGGDRPSSEDYLSRAVLRPYVELLRSLRISPERAHRRGCCPFCGGLAGVGARRDGSSTEGARRMLDCALCGQEWAFERILCPSCFEENPYKLPSFQDARHPGVRIESCETCHRYVKTIDLSEDARPIPEIDDLASIAMDLWAMEQGLTRIEPGLAGI